MDETNGYSKIADVMTSRVFTVLAGTCLRDVARLMRDQDIGDVLVLNEDGSVRGIVTDRDIVVRSVAAGEDMTATCAGEVASDQLVVVTPDTTVDEAIELMSRHAIRRIPVMKDGAPVGIVSIGDLARTQDPHSALAHISQAHPNH
jgi:signal-transduction protein with cAMP-binding, CBS, and nucleotidyltransferase domain